MSQRHLVECHCVLPLYKDKKPIIYHKFAVEQNLLYMTTFMLLAIPSGASIALIVLAILLLFGGKKIPELMRGLGKGMKEFKNAKDENPKDSEDKE